MKSVQLMPISDIIGIRQSSGHETQVFVTHDYYILQHNLEIQKYDNVQVNLQRNA